MKQGKTFVLLFLLLTVGVFFYAGTIQADAPEELYAQSAVLMDGKTGRLLYDKNGEEPRAMASTTKIMTAILVLEACEPEELCETSPYAASMPQVHLGAQPGEQYLVKDLLYSLMLESHNDSAVILAEHVSGTVSKFAQKMNEKAETLGCKDTCFFTPNGLDEEEGEQFHHTTAEDLARIMRYCILESPKKEEFLAITGTPEYHFSNVEGTRTCSLRNHNAFLTMMEGACSGKTGYTAKAGYCYVGALEREGQTLIVALLGCGWPHHRDYKWKDTRTLMEYGLAHYQVQHLSKAALSSIPRELPVEQGIEDKVQAVRVPMEDNGILLAPEDRVQAVYRGKTSLLAPIKKGEKIGEIQYQVNGIPCQKEEVVAGKNVEPIDFPWCLKEIIRRWEHGCCVNGKLQRKKREL